MFKSIPAVLMAALLLSVPASADELRARLLPPSGSDLVPTRLDSAKRALPANLESAAVDFAWPIASDSKLAAARPHVAASREFWSLQDARQLAAGFRFEVGSPGALIRISPADGAKTTGDAAPVAIRLNGRELSDGRGILRSAAAAELKKLGADFGDGSRVFQLDPAAGTGTVEVQIAKAGGRHLVHVLEPNSDQVLELRSHRDVALAGGELELYADWRSGDRSLAPTLLRGLITAPDGRSIEIEFVADPNGGQRARARLPATDSAVSGLWEAHVFAAADHQGRHLLRDAKTAFAVTAPTARLANRISAALDGNGLALTVAIDASAAGRYELRGTLYGTDATGTLVPFAVAHSARILDAGPGEIVIRLDRALLADAGVGAPFELRDLALNDQGRFAAQELRARAARIELDSARSEHGSTARR